MPLEGLSEELAENESLADFEDVSALAEGYLASQRQHVDWKSGLDDDLKGEASLADIKDINSLTKGYVSAQKMIGQRQEGMVKLPGKDATPEDVEAFHKAMGRPDMVEGYEFAKPDDMPDGLSLDDGMVKWFSETAFAAGLSKAQAGALMKAWNDNQFAQAHEAQKALGKDIQALQDRWGDEFDGRVELGVRAIESLLPGDEVKALKEVFDSSGLGNNPLMLKLAYQMGKMLKEDGYIIGDGHGGILGPDSAKAKIKEINENKDHPHWNPGVAGHKEALEEMAQLFKVAYPT